MASGPLANTQSNIDGWKSIHLDPNEDNVMVFLDEVILFRILNLTVISNVLLQL